MNKLLVIFSSILLIISSVKSSDEYNDNYDYNTLDYKDNDNNSVTPTDSTDEYEYEEDEEDQCTVDDAIDQLTALILPDDYEEGKQLAIKHTVKHINETIAIFRRLAQYGHNVSAKLEPIMKRVMPRFTDILLAIDLPPDCMSSVIRIGQAAQEGETWAFKFIDSMPAPDSGQLELIIPPMIGEYDECLSIESPHQSDKPTIFGKYCTLTPRLPLPPGESYNEGDPIDPFIEDLVNDYLISSNKSLKAFGGAFRESDGRYVLQPNVLKTALDSDLQVQQFPLGLGVCLPTTCRAKDIEYAINKLMYPISKIPVQIGEQTCEYANKPRILNKYEKVAVVTYAVLIALVSLSTVYHFAAIFFPVLPPNLITNSFSLIINWKKFLPAKKSSSANKFSCLDGIRAILCLNVYLSHLYVFWSMTLFANKGVFTAFKRLMKEYKYILLRNLYMPHIFMLLGGMMTSYIMLSKLEKSRGRFNYFHYVLYRYLRLIFALVGAIFLIYLMPLTGDGPLWNFYMEGLGKACWNNWNASVLMVSNYDFDLPLRMICNPPTYYTSADFQLYMIAPILFLFIYKSPKYGLIFNVAVIVVSCFIHIAPKVVFGIPHFHEIAKYESLEHAMHTIRHHYYGAQQYIGTYSVGILLGYLVRHKPDLYFGGFYGELCVWCVTWAMTAWGIAWHRDYFTFEYAVGETEILLFGAFQKYFFIAGWVWGVYACVTGRAGFINKFLSWKGFKYFSNISLEIYLVHSLPIIYRISSIRHQVIVSDYYMLTLIPYDFIVTFVIALALHLLVTAPFTNLVNAILLPKKKASQQEEQAKQEPIFNNNNNDENLKKEQTETAVNNNSNDMALVMVTNNLSVNNTTE